jgi:hypothetical protein
MAGLQKRALWAHVFGPICVVGGWRNQRNILMSTYNMNTMMTNREMALAVVALPFYAIARSLRNIGQNSSRVQRLNELNAMSDAELAAQDLTRAQAAQQILRSHF